MFCRPPLRGGHTATRLKGGREKIKEEESEANEAGQSPRRYSWDRHEGYVLLLLTIKRPGFESNYALRERGVIVVRKHVTKAASTSSGSRRRERNLLAMNIR